MPAASLGPVKAANPKGTNMTPKFMGRCLEPKASAVSDASCPMKPPKAMPTIRTGTTTAKGVEASQNMAEPRMT